MRISEEMLQKLWKKWLHDVRRPLVRDQFILQIPNHFHLSRANNIRLEFERWLYSHGISTKQENRVRFAEILDPDACIILFLGI